MLVQVLSFGSNWWARFGSDPCDSYRFTRHAAYYNSTGIPCGRKVRRHWIVSGLVRFNGVGEFDPYHPRRSIGRTFECPALASAFGGNRLILEKRAERSAVAAHFLVVLSTNEHGRVDFRSSDWKSPSSEVVAASQLREKQETMLLMRTGDWVRTNCGVWQLLMQNGSNRPTLNLLEAAI